MKKIIFLLFGILLFSCEKEESAEVIPNKELPPAECEKSSNYVDIANQISWYGDACFSIQTDEYLIFADPYDINTSHSADVLLISHPHHNRYQSVNNVVTDQTIALTSKDVTIFSAGEHHGMLPNSKYIINECFSVRSIPAYGDGGHPKANNWIGFLISLNGVSIYYTGSSMRIPEMQGIECDIVLVRVLPQHAIADMAQIAEIVKDVGAKIAIPLHWDVSAVTSKPNHENVVELARLLEGIAEVKELENTEG